MSVESILKTLEKTIKQLEKEETALKNRAARSQVDVDLAAANVLKCTVEAERASRVASNLKTLLK